MLYLFFGRPVRRPRRLTGTVDFFCPVEIAPKSELVFDWWSGVHA